MRGPALGALTAVALGLLAACSSPGGDGAVPLDVTPQADAKLEAGGASDAVGSDADPLAGLERTYNTTCRLAGESPPPPPLALQRVLSGVTLAKPVQLTPVPGAGERVALVGQGGRVLVADAVTEDGGATLWLDLSQRIEAGPNEAGLLSLAFHPQFATNGRLFVNYTRSVEGQLQTVVSRFTVPDPPFGAPDPASEAVVITVDQPYGNHNGGGLAFGPDGYLYVGMGDGGSGGDPLGHGQNLGTLLGAFLRLDVDAPGDDVGYAVPPDNPFVDQPGARPEIWAWGLRNPWGFAFDPVDGALWSADVGQSKVEEVNLIERGRNYGWNTMEGTRCYPTGDACDKSGLTLPVAEYEHAEGKSVTGGRVYRGSAIPSLYGTYVFADFVFGSVWGLTPGADGAFTRTTLAQTSAQISHIGADAAGELIVLDWTLGRFHRLVPADPDAPAPAGWPARLSDTGCFDDLPTRRLADGILAYDVNVPLWSDDAAKERGLVLPQDGTLAWSDAGPLGLPDGTILIKSFVRDGHPLETRFLVRAGDAWRGATYRWNAQGTDAELMTTGATTDVHGGPTKWTFPSRGECLTCHTAHTDPGAAGDGSRALGLTAAQLHRAHDVFGLGVDVPQLASLQRLGYLTGAPDDLAAAPRWPAPDDASAPLADRARAWLDANCAHCHRPGGLANATFDLRAATPLADAGLCDVAPSGGDLGVPGARLLSPGAPDASLLALRIASTDPAFRMPPVGVLLPDPQGLALVREWIAALPGCP